MNKTPSIQDVLNRLASDLGVHAFVIADHWKDEATATAIACPNNGSQLVYFCQSPDDDTLFDYELETAPVNPDERIYDVAGRGSNATYEVLRDIVRRHLGTAS